MFERVDYIVAKIDGDYAFLQEEANPQAEQVCVARALLPAAIMEGTRLAYEMLEYRII